MKYIYEFHGGELDGQTMTGSQVEKMAIGHTENLTSLRNIGALVHRSELDDQPIVSGYLGPMFDGIRILGTDGVYHYSFCRDFTPAVPQETLCILRYETQEVYNASCD